MHSDPFLGSQKRKGPFGPFPLVASRQNIPMAFKTVSSPIGNPSFNANERLKPRRLCQLADTLRKIIRPPLSCCPQALEGQVIGGISQLVIFDLSTSFRSRENHQPLAGTVRLPQSALVGKPSKNQSQAVLSTMDLS